MTAAEQATSVAGARAKAVSDTIDRIREIEGLKGVTRESLSEMREHLYALAAQTDLFSKEDFPPPTDGDTNVRYVLSEDDDQRFALYLNSILPGKLTEPHNHTTWAIVVAVDGEEINKFYDRKDDGSVPGKATLELGEEVTVKPGIGVAMMPDDVHSIAVVGDTPTLHFHMYGRAIETLTERVGYNIEEGTYEYYKLQGQNQR
ncbi:MAG: cysteine dioxygenase [Alphaproteobacteria bacterium]|nr:cysteine dioxygenase [Alphaproteobacteria bacterium]|tara:strand:- start:385 stop:993 length:609 start_codon:yes stop_codon:yes gene_type:complete